MSDSHTIYIGQDEDITSIIDHLTAVDSESVILVIPEEAEIFSSVVNLRLLKREADLQDKSILIVSSSKIGEYLAEKAQIPFEKRPAPTVNKKIISDLKDKEPLPGEKRVQIDIPVAGKVFLNEGAVKVRRMADIVFPSQTGAEAFGPVLPREQGLVNDKLETDDKNELASYNFPDNNLEFEEANVLENSADEDRSYSQAHKFSPQPAIEDYTGTSNYKQAESSYLAKYLQGSGQTDVVSESGFREDKNRDPRNAVGKSLSSKKLKKIIAALIILGVLTFIFAAFFILPKADLIITPKRDSSSFDLRVVADKNITKNDYSLKRIPAQFFKIEKKETRDFTATGSSSGSSKAKGIITVYNAYSTSPQTLVQSTRFAAADTGKVFRIIKTITVPGAKSENGKLIPSSVDAEVLADQAGVDYNISPSKFNIPGFQGTPKYTGFYGKSSLAMAGGSSGAATVVSAQDLENAKKDLSAQIKSEIDTALKEQIPSNFKLLDGALRQGDPTITFSQQAGDPAQKFIATFSINLSALVFDINNLNNLVDKTAIASTQDKKTLLPATRQLDYSNSHVDFDSGQINFDVKAQEDFVYKIDTENLKKKLAGKKEAEIKQALSQMPEILNIKVMLWPFWVKSIPAQVGKIYITVE